MSDIRWQEPPPSEKGPKGVRWRDIADALRQRPGEWALVTTSTQRTVVFQIKIGDRAGMRRGEFDATSRVRPDGRFDIYARYIGHLSEDD